MFSCGEKNKEKNNDETVQKEEDKKKKKKDEETKEVELCRCLNEPGNTDWAKENKEDCDEAISNKIGVSNWKSVNFSQNSNLSAKWDKMINECVNNQLENDSKETSFQEISFEEAKEFMQKRFENSGQMLIDGKTTYHNGGDLKVYYFISQSTQYSGYYCLAGVSSKKLEMLGNIDCGRDEIMSMFMNK
tara:strand:- start:81 stop:647 length:567 start_codon:yes stop_codon:yes gene_type:complete